MSTSPAPYISQEAVITLESLACEIPVAEIHSGLERLDTPRP